MAEIVSASEDHLGPEVPSSAALPPRFRVTMRTLMVLVLTAAVASALFSELRRPFAAKGMTQAGIDIPAIVLLAVVLNSVALGCWLGLSVNRVLLQITICCLLLLGGALLWNWRFDRGLLYGLQISFAAVVVLPLLVKAVVTGGGDRNRRIAAGVNDLLLAYLNFVVILIVATFQTVILAILLSALR